MPLDVSLRDTAERIEAATAELAEQLTKKLHAPCLQRQGIGPLHRQFVGMLAEMRAVVLRYERALRGQGTAEKATGRVVPEHRPYFKRLRRRLQLLEGIATGLQLAVAAAPQPLYPQWFGRRHAVTTQVDLLDAAMIWLHRMAIPPQQSQAAIDLGCYPDLPLGSVRFMGHAHAAYRVALAQKRAFPLRFLDVGCGGGVKVLLASGLFGDALGFDYDESYVQAAQQSFAKMGARRCQAFWGNGLEYENYADFDVIYFFKPMSDEAVLARMEAKIVNEARPGTILIAPYQEFFLRHQGYNCTRIADVVYITALPDAEVQALHLEAQRMGTDVLSPDRSVHSTQAGWLRDLFMACAANGYQPD